VSAKVSHDTTNKTGSDYTPDVSFIVSDHFADKKVGLLAAVSYSERDSRLESGNIAGLQRIVDRDPGFVDSSANTNDRNALYLARSFNLETQDVQRKRLNGQFVLQLAPTENVEIALDYNLSRYDEFSQRNSTGFWFGFDGQRQGVSDANGVVDLFDDGNNIDLDAFGFVNDLVTDNDSFGINVDWFVNDRLSFNLDAHSSVSESQPGGELAELVINFRTPNVDFVSLNFNDGDIPSVNYGAGFDVFDTSQLISDIGQQRGRSIKNEIDEIKLVGAYEFDNGTALKTITFGGSVQDYTYAFDQVTTFFLLNGFDNGAVGFGSEPIGSTFSDFSGGGPGLFPRLFTYDPLAAVQGAQVDGFFQAPEFQVESVQEDTTSLFVQADFETSISAMPLRVNVGVRYEETDVIGQTAAQPILNTQLINAAEIRLVRAPGLVNNTLEGNYDFLLPSLNAKLDVSDDFVVRASYSETITRQPIANLTPRFQFNALRPGANGAGAFFVERGNADLEPALAKSLDLSFEWYYSEGSYASLGLFNKDVSAFIVRDTIETTLTDANGNLLRDPSFNAGARVECPGAGCVGLPTDPEITFDVTTRFNSEEEGTVRGAEIALQHVFDNGFGFIANYTYTDGDIEYDNSNFDAQEPEPLLGLSDSANIVGFYENERFQARIAYNWRDDFLFSAGQDPQYVEEYSQVDFSASYNINDNYSIFFEGLNITDEISRRHGRNSQLLSRVTSSGPRYSVGFRGNF
jgi:TonB-dependent receptor